MERLTKYITPVGKCMTTLNSMKHYMPCVPCRHKAEIKTDSKGNMYTEKFSFCDTCEVKMLFNKLKEYEDAEEQGLLLKLPCKVGDTIYLLDYEERKFDEATVEEIMIDSEGLFINTDYANYLHTKLEYVFLTKVEAQTALEKMKGE